MPTDTVTVIMEMGDDYPNYDHDKYYRCHIKDHDVDDVDATRVGQGRLRWWQTTGDVPTRTKRR